MPEATLLLPISLTAKLLSLLKHVNVKADGWESRKSQQTLSGHHTQVPLAKKWEGLEDRRCAGTR